MRAVILAASIALCALPAFAASKVYRVGSWTVTEKSDPITDAKWIIMTTDTSDPRGFLLQLRCEKGKPYMVVILPDAKFKESEHARAAIRVDKGAPTSASFAVADDTALVTGMTNTTFSKIVTAKTIGLRIEYEPAIWSIAFSPTQTQRAAKALLNACPLGTGVAVEPKPYDPNAPREPVEKEPDKAAEPPPKP